MIERRAPYILSVIAAIGLVLPFAGCMPEDQKPTMKAAQQDTVALPGGGTAQIIALETGERIFLYEKRYPGEAGGAIGCCMLPPLPAEKSATQGGVR